MAQTLHAKAIIQAVDGVSGPLAGIARSFATLEGRLDRSIGTMGRAAASAGRTLTLGVTAPAALAVRQFMQYEDALLDLQKVFPGTAEQMEGLTRHIDRMARVVPLSRVELTQLAEAASRSNIPLAEIPEFMRLAAEFSVAFGTTAGESAEKLAKLKTALNLSVPELRQMSDSMNVLANNSAASEAEILEVIRRTAALTKSIGGAGAARQLAALGGAMVASGVEAEVAGTGIRNMWLQLTAGTSATKDVKSALKELGLAAPAVAKALTTDTFATVLDLLERIDKKAPDVRARLLGDLFGKRAVDALAPLIGNLGEFRRQLGLISDETRVAGSTQKEYEQRVKGLSSGLRLLRNDLEGIAQVIVQKWLPSIRSGLKAVRSFLQSFDEQPAVVQWAAQITGALAVAGPVLWAFGAGLQGIVSIVGIAGRTFAWFAQGGLRLLGPLGAIAAAGYAIFTNWHQVAPAWNRVGDASDKLFTAIARLTGLDNKSLSGLAGMFDGWDLSIAQSAAQAANSLADSLERLADLVDRFRQGDILGGLKNFLASEFKPVNGGFDNSLAGKAVEWLRSLRSDRAEPSQHTERPDRPASDLFEGAPKTTRGGPSVPVVPRPPSPELQDALGSISRTFRQSLAPQADRAAGSGVPGGLVRDLARGPTGPQTIDVTGKVAAELKGKGQVNVRIHVEGPGRVTGITASDDGKHIQLDAGTTMQDVAR